MRGGSISRKGIVCLAVLAAAIIVLCPEAAFAVASMEYYISEVDGSQQPFGLYLPDPFDTNVPHPVAIQLHGGGVRASPPSPVGELSRGWIIVTPDGRGEHALWFGLQENDVFRVLDEIRSRYPNAVDENRIYVTGCSAGGFGSARLPFTYPDVFAAAAPHDGCYDFYWWHTQVWGPSGNVNELHPIRAPLLGGVSPLYVAENARNLNLYLGVSTGDSMGTSEANKLRNRLNELAYAYSYNPFPGGHCAGYRPSEIYEFFCQHVREPNPAQVVLKANHLKYGSAFWVRIDRLAKSMEFATIEASITGKEKDRVEVAASGLLQYTLRLTPALFGKDEISLYTNGELT